MKKVLWNMAVDIAGLLAFTSMISSGVILKFILPPGSGRPEVVLGSQGRGHSMIDLFMGLSRHEWGEIHFVISMVFLAVLATHLILHKDWIVAMLWGTPSAPQSSYRRGLTVVTVIFVIGALISPWLGQAAGLKQSYTRGEYRDLLNNH